MASLHSRIQNELFPFVKQPGQYIGGEVNQLVHDGDWERADVRVAVAFPDTYTVGMSHLGCQILYWLVNHTPGCCAERVYCPWGDAESLMRQRKIPLFTWDSRQPAASADIFAVSLQYEMAYTSVLQLFDLAGIPLYAADRGENDPIVIAGGPQADNPEPVAPFLDLVVLGDGEESMSAILAAFKELKANRATRSCIIRDLAGRFPWIYAPSLYKVTYNLDRTIGSVEPIDATLPATIVRCQTPDFERSAFPLRPLVPHVEVIHDRMAIEIMRGCPQRCRFCHAGYTKRPLRVRSVNRILDMAEEMYRATGMDELGLLSLSTADYPQLRALMTSVNERFASRNVNVSVPSLRVDKMLKNIPWMVNSVRKSGLTMAVEAAKDDMRSAIRKHVTDGDLLDGVREAYKAGWRRLKLYFMCGFPGERPDDIDAIVDLSQEVAQTRRELGKPPAHVTVSVGWLVPKPYTPFQWAAQARADYFHEARRRLQRRLGAGRNGKRKSGVVIRTHSVERSILEGVFARGDRRLAPVIEHAYRAGARFDGWDECFHADTWRRAFEATGVDPDWYAHRERPASEVFPWTHLMGGPPDDYLHRQYNDVFTQLNKPSAIAAAV